MSDSRPPPLAGRTALVIGGTSGIGRAIAEAYLTAGAKVGVVGRNRPKLDDAVTALKRLGPAFGYAGDMREDADVRGVIGATLAHHGRLDALVNCQGITILKPAIDFTREDWDEIMATDLRSVFMACQEAGRYMTGRGKGSIINIASLASYRGWPRSALYAIAKSGVLSLTETLAAEWAQHGVRVNGIAPGFVLTDMNRDRMSPERKQLAVARTPMARFGTPQDMAGAAVFLASDAAAYITGETIRVDGGFLATGL